MKMDKSLLYNFLSSIKKHFLTKIDENNLKDEKIYVLRANLKDDNEAKLWVKSFGNETRTEWIVNKTLSYPQRVIYRKTWLCRHSKKNKCGNSSKLNTNCKASIDIIIKKNNKGTRRNDAFLKQHPPLCAVIRVQYEHNHNISTVEALRFLRTTSENCLSTLPMNLCIKCSEHQGRGYEVWSLEDINIGIRFGPCKGRFVDSSEQHRSRDFQCKVETTKKIVMTLDGSEEKESNWLRYVKYASNKGEQNLVAVQCHSEIYFIACKAIPANTQLFVWDQVFFENRNNHEEEMSVGYSLAETQNTPNFSAMEKPKQGKQVKEMDQYLETISIQPSVLPISSFNQLKPVCYIPLPDSNKLGTLGYAIQHLYIITSAITTRQENSLVIRDKCFECEICHKRYAEKYQLRDHEMNHTGERPFQCIICQKNYKTRGYLMQHLQIHSTKQSYECDICKQNYKTADSLKKHKLWHSRKEKWCECKVCNCSENRQFFQKI